MRTTLHPYNIRIETSKKKTLSATVYHIHVVLTIKGIRRKRLITVLQESEWNPATKEPIGKRGFIASVKGTINARIVAIEENIRLNPKKPLTHELAFGELQEEFSKSQVSFYDYMCETYKAFESEGRSSGTLRNYDKVIRALATFDTKTTLDCIDTKWANDLKRHWNLTRDLSANGMWEYFKIVKTFWNRAYDEELVITQPFKKIKLKQTPTKRNFLSRDELRKLEDLYHNKELLPKYLNVLQYFLFSCYTGISYVDIKRFNKSLNVHDGLVRLDRSKTEANFVVPLIGKSKAILEEIDDVFRVITREKTNEYLKDIMLWARIPKNITYHCARHTFATLGLTSGIDLKTVSGMLGHSSVKMTEIYAKLQEDKIKNDMTKLDQMLND